MIKRIVLYLTIVLVCVLAAAAYYFFQSSPSDDPVSPFHESEMEDYVRSRITPDVSGFEIESEVSDALILTLTKWRTRILVVFYRPILDEEEPREALALLISPEHSRKTPFDPSLEPGWCGTRYPSGGPSSSGFSAGCIETRSCEESVLLDCATGALADVLAGSRVLSDGRSLRWKDKVEFKEYSRSMQASFAYEEVDVYRYTRSTNEAGRSGPARLDVVVAPNGEILGSAAYFMEMTHPW